LDLSDKTAAPSGPSRQQWVVACRLDEVVEACGTKAELADGRVVAIFRVDGQCYAIDDRCTHGAASLSEGLVEGRVVECPFHAGTFDIISGKALTSPCIADVRAYRVRVDGNAVLIGIGT
jgi:nitrite reductase/ring-hydroxylating ferredoxin subunit